MKKQKNIVHVVSSVAALFGTSVVNMNSATADENFEQDPSYMMDVMDGGATGSMNLNGGNTSVAATSTATGVADITLTVNCAGTTDRFSCDGAFLLSTAIESAITFQNICSGGSMALNFTLACVSGVNYPINFKCLNTTKYTGMKNNNPTASVTCV